VSKNLEVKKILSNKIVKMIPRITSLPTHMLWFLPSLYETLPPLLQASPFLSGRVQIRAQKKSCERLNWH